MAFTVVGYYKNLPASSDLTELTAITDGHVTTSGNDVLVPSFATNVAGVYVLGQGSTQAQLTTPSLRERLLLDIPIIDQSATPSNHWLFNDYTKRTITLVSGEGMRFKANNADTANAYDTYAFVFLYDTFEALPSREINTVRCTASGSVTANEWSLLQLTFSQQLEAGRYALVGAKVIDSSAVCARFVLPGSAFRPGLIVNPGVNSKENPLFRNGQLGVWGYFEHTFPPQLEILSTGTSTPSAVYLDLIGPL